MFTFKIKIMAKADGNAFDGFIGRLGDTVTYIRKGKLIKRTIGKSTKPPSLSQIRYRARIKLYSELLKAAKKLVALGYASAAGRLNKCAHDLFSSQVLTNCIIGDHPDQRIDFTKVLFSKGDMPLTPGTTVVQTEEGLKFTWDKSLVSDQFRTDDLALLIVYYPELKSVYYDTAAAKRIAGEAHLELEKKSTPKIMEIYISFRNDETISDSVYLGQLILPAANKRR